MRQEPDWGVTGNRESGAPASLLAPFNWVLTVKDLHGSAQPWVLCQLLTAHTYAAIVDGALFFMDRKEMNLFISRLFAGPCLAGGFLVFLKCSKLLLPTSNIRSVLGAHDFSISLSVSWSKAAIEMAESLLAVCRLLGHLI
jgi:hypothetical protein